MNHLEQLVSEWLQYNGYFVRTAMLGRRVSGGFEGELDVVAVDLTQGHLIHVECSLDGGTKAKREERFATNFEESGRYAHALFHGMELPEDIDRAVVLQFPRGQDRYCGGARLVNVRELTSEIMNGLKGTSPASGAVSSNLPLLRTLQLAADSTGHPEAPAHRLIPLKSN